jgi:hypothetical protein
VEARDAAAGSERHETRVVDALAIMAREDKTGKVYTKPLEAPGTIGRQAGVVECDLETLIAIGALSGVKLCRYGSAAMVRPVVEAPFNSAVSRRMPPETFGVIDWGNLAVSCCSPSLRGS